MQDRRQHHRHRNKLVGLGLLIALATACSSPKHAGTRRPPTSAPAEALSSSDPCAQRLHDLSGGLLLYYAQHQRLPPNLTDLQLPGGAAGAAEALVCPVSNQPYVYDPRGLAAPDGKFRLVVYDSTPAHHGRRWAIAIMETGDAQPLTTDVVAAPESSFASPR